MPELTENSPEARNLPELTDAERRALHELRRLVAAAENTLKLAEDGRYGDAYANLNDRMERMKEEARWWLRLSMTERRWRRG